MSLNLGNFETEYSRDTPYILTSPRSLKACSVLGVQPIELVYRSVEEYEEALCDLPLSEIYRIYEENETKRQGLLLKCREQREFIKHGCSTTMAIFQPYQESSSNAEDSNATSSSPQPQNNNNNNIRHQHHRPSARSESRSAGGGGGRKLSKNNKNESNISSSSKSPKNKRYTSAPSESSMVTKQISRGSSQSNLNVRQSASFQRNNLKNNSASNLLISTPRTRSRSGGGSGSGRRSRLVIENNNSDTESTTGREDRTTRNYGHTLLIDNPYYNRSVPDLTHKSNLDFRKVSSSPRNHPNCPCNWDLELQDRNVLAQYLKQYGDILESPDLSLEDRKIMECMILKRGKEVEWEKKSQEMRKLLEKERIQRWTENQLLQQSWHEKLAEKRHFENLENTKRYLDLQDKWKSSRSNLMHYLEERDRKVQRYLEDMNYKKKKSLLEKQKREALRQLEVGKAIEKLVDEDRQHRQMLKDKLQRQMENADVRKRRRERNYYRHVSEMNRMEDIKRSLKLEQLEQKSRENVEELKNQIEEKEHRARLNYLNRIQVRDRALSEGSGSRQKALEKVQGIHADLLKGLEEWHKKVLELHIEAQKRAEIKYNQEIHRKRIHVASERILREERSSEMLKRVQELEEQRKDLLKTMIQSKESRTARVKADKERKVQISRIRAQHAAELRLELKNKLDPETFDRKAARAEMELRIMKRNPPSGFHVRFNPKLINKRCSSCYASGGKRTPHSQRHNSSCGHNSAKVAHSGYGGPMKCFHSV